MTGTDGAEGFAVSSAGDDGIGSPFGGILGAPTGGGYLYDAVLESLDVDTGLPFPVGGFVGAIADAILNGGDRTDTDSGDALAAGRTGEANANHTATPAGPPPGHEAQT